MLVLSLRFSFCFCLCIYSSEARISKKLSYSLPLNALYLFWRWMGSFCWGFLMSQKTWSGIYLKIFSSVVVAREFLYASVRSLV
jgi:hypothetical protein